jgi:hypothetical protein
MLKELHTNTVERLAEDGFHLQNQPYAVSRRGARPIGALGKL